MNIYPNDEYTNVIKIENFKRDHWKGHKKEGIAGVVMWNQWHDLWNIHKVNKIISHEMFHKVQRMNMQFLNCVLILTCIRGGNAIILISLKGTLYTKVSQGYG